MTSMWSVPRNPHLKPKPSASDTSGSYTNEESLRVSFAKASLNFSYSSELTVNRDAKTFGRTFLNPGSGNVDSSFDSIMVSPTGAP